MAGPGPVVQEDQRFIVDDHQCIDPAVIVEVAGRQSTPQMGGPERRPGPRRNVPQAAVPTPRRSWMGIA